MLSKVFGPRLPFSARNPTPANASELQRASRPPVGFPYFFEPRNATRRDASTRRQWALHLNFGFFDASRETSATRESVMVSSFPKFFADDARLLALRPGARCHFRTIWCEEISPLWRKLRRVYPPTNPTLSRSEIFLLTEMSRFYNCGLKIIFANQDGVNNMYRIRWQWRFTASITNGFYPLRNHFSLFAFRLSSIRYTKRKSQVVIILLLRSSKLKFIHYLYTSRDNRHFHLIPGHVLHFISRPNANSFILDWRLWRSTDGRSNFNTFPTLRGEEETRECRPRTRKKSFRWPGKTEDEQRGGGKKLRDP